MFRASSVPVPAMRGPLPNVKMTSLVSHQDERGEFTELFRNEWVDTPPPVQWNLVRSRPGVLRGVHVHVRHDDYLVVLRGSLILGTCDLRESSPDFLRSQRVEISGTRLTLVTIPTGIAHGFYFPEPTDYVYAVTHYWNPQGDALGCFWNDPGLNVAWPTSDPELSERDRKAKSLSELLSELSSRRDKTW